MQNSPEKSVQGAGSRFLAIGLTAATMSCVTAVHAGNQWSLLLPSALSPTSTATKGAGFADFNGDGFLDIIFMNPGTPDNVLAQNMGDGTWMNVTPVELLGGAQAGMPVTADYDNDGDLDLWFNNWSTPASLLRNDGNFTFTTFEIDPRNQKSRGATVGDIDGDGVLDFFVSRQGSTPTSTDRIFTDDGSGFVETTPAVLTTGDVGRGVVLADFDDDGDLDVYNANGNGCPCEWETLPPEWEARAVDRLYRNDGGVLVDVSNLLPPTVNSNGRGVTVGDYDNDGDLDLFVAGLAIAGEIDGPNNIGLFGGQNRLLRNDGDLVFTDVTPAIMIDDTTKDRSCAFADIDNDGDLDLHTAGLGTGNSKIWENLGNNNWIDATPLDLAFFSDGRSGAFGDMDRDGDLDAFLTFGTSALNALLRNNAEANGNHWAIIDVEGVISNRSAIGATVRLTAGGSTQIRPVVAGTSYWAQHQLSPHFGLGAATQIDMIRVDWPDSILVSRRSGLAVDQYISMVEPSSCTDLVDGSDCNGNGIRDECDIADGTLPDADGDGIPDSCESVCPLDVDENGMVGAPELITVLASWGICPKSCPIDTNDDGMVGAPELISVLAAWGPCPG